jgi:hypothetical protein
MPVLPPANALAKIFSQNINNSLSQEELAEVNRLNSLPNRDFLCATSDLIDSNQCMADALEIFGLDFHPKLIPLINEAWQIAKLSQFKPSSNYDCKIKI